ncbi:MAG: hypothetical protein B7Z80_12955 [Rhodospirillales bacterium 20-64-7]|nr:MAG: hypothetical protein B7Z80_12955 [Rhodospirillales bacterium 20-64-7]
MWLVPVLYLAIYLVPCVLLGECLTIREYQLTTGEVAEEQAIARAIVRRVPMRLARHVAVHDDSVALGASGREPSDGGREVPLRGLDDVRVQPHSLEPGRRDDDVIWLCYVHAQAALPSAFTEEPEQFVHLP